MLTSNEPIKDAHLQKLANQSMLNEAPVIEMVNECIFKLVCHCESCSLSKIGCA